MVCDKYKEQRGLYFALSLCCACSEHSDVSDSARMMERRGSRGKKFVTQDEISAELLADTLSDVPDNGKSDSDFSVIGNTQKKIVQALPSCSESEQSTKESDDDTLDSVVSTWVKTDKTPNLGHLPETQG